MNNPVFTNPLRTRGDLEKAAVQLLAPLCGKLSGGRARLHLGDTGAVYPAYIAEMEAYARPLWAIVPMLAGSCGGAEELWSLWAEGLRSGVDPDSREYWGKIGPFDQRMVEMAVMGMALCMIPEKFFFALDEKTQQNLFRWLDQINDFDMPQNNWRFFRVLVNTGFRICGLPFSQARLDEDFGLIEAHYEGDGWYYDYFDQREYYTMWAYHFYGLIYARVMRDRDPERAARFLERGKLMAPRFAVWFATDGEALPYGRSLTYRFAQGAFFAALAYAEGATADFGYGEMKHLLLSNLRKWVSRPIFRQDGVLSIGYGYPDLLMAEGYNAPGSPYWAMKVFLALALPASHPFWQAEEKAPVCPERFLEAHSRMLLLRTDGGCEVQAFTAGNHAAQHAHDEAKYEKFCYSTTFAFSVSKCRERLAAGAFDNMLAVSDDGMDYRPRYGTTEFAVTADRVTSVWHPYSDVTIRSTLLPLGNGWHVRIHHIQAGRDLFAAEGGFAIKRNEGHDDARTERTDDGCMAHERWGLSGILRLRGYDDAELVLTEPNTNLLYPRTILPTLTARIPAGETLLACAVLGTPEDDLARWSAPPTALFEQALGEALGGQRF